LGKGSGIGSGLRLAALGLALAAAPAAAQRCESVVRDAVRGRTVPVAVTLPEAGDRLPVVIWSPGLGGGRALGGAWAEQWAAAGIATVQLQHPGSDAMVYGQAAAAARAAPDPAAAERARRARIAQGTAPEQLAARLGDVALVMARLRAGDGLGACLTVRIDAERAGIGGHSMGAWLAQRLAGPAGGFMGGLAVSGGVAVAGAIEGPFMLVTSVADGIAAELPAARKARELAARTALWEQMQGGEHWLFVAGAGSHNELAGTPSRTPAALVARLGALTGLYWRAVLLGDARARARLAATEAGPGERFEWR
jgi:predicted dienelactone hydrolase